MLGRKPPKEDRHQRRVKLDSGTVGVFLSIFLGFGILVFLVTRLPSSSLLLGRRDAYTVSAAFENVGSLEAGASVTIAGVDVGRVRSVRFDPKLRQAVATLRIQSEYNSIPIDSAAAIQAQGLSGSATIAISPGGSSESLRDKGSIQNTRSAFIVEQLVNRIFSGTMTPARLRQTTDQGKQGPGR